jgi:hypothetical protein
MYYFHLIQHKLPSHAQADNPRDVSAINNIIFHPFRAEALQSLFLLLGEREIYEYVKYYKTDFSTLDWTLDKAKQVLQAWQRKFTQVIRLLLKSHMEHVKFDYK